MKLVFSSFLVLLFSSTLFADSKKIPSFRGNINNFTGFSSADFKLALAWETHCGVIVKVKSESKVFAIDEAGDFDVKGFKIKAKRFSLCNIVNLHGGLVNPKLTDVTGTLFFGNLSGGDYLAHDENIPALIAALSEGTLYKVEIPSIPVSLESGVPVKDWLEDKGSYQLFLKVQVLAPKSDGTLGQLAVVDYRLNEAGDQLIPVTPFLKPQNSLIFALSGLHEKEKEFVFRVRVARVYGNHSVFERDFTGDTLNHEFPIDLQQGIVIPQ